MVLREVCRFSDEPPLKLLEKNQLQNHQPLYSPKQQNKAHQLWLQSLNYIFDGQFPGQLLWQALLYSYNNDSFGRRQKPQFRIFPFSYPVEKFRLIIFCCPVTAEISLRGIITPLS